MTLRVGEIAAWMEEIAPLDLADEGDNVGLQLGDPCREVEKVLLAIDVTVDVLDEAISRGAGMIISHHPLIFRPLRRLSEDEPVGRLVAELLRKDIALYSAHTNLDRCEEGVNASLAEALGLMDVRPLKPSSNRYYKLVTFVPPDHLDGVREALFGAGAGEVGKYRRCSYYLLGEGTFLPLEGASPYVGQEGREERTKEHRLEVLVEGGRLASVLASLKEAHPYEEPAVDVYPLSNSGRVDHGAGMGRVGVLDRSLSLVELARMCRDALGCEAARVFGDPGRRVRRVAVCGGRGGYLVPDAAEVAEVLVTGDVDHHQALDALARGLALLDAGHYHTERPVLARLKGLLAKKARERGVEAHFLVSESQTCRGTVWVQGYEQGPGEAMAGGGER